ncbi:MAG: glutaredoxin family protein, partial [Solirubrobacteraceae bacterium]
MSDETTNTLRDQIQTASGENPVILFMKGTPEQPMCGFSARTVAILQSVGRPFAAVNILPDTRIRKELSTVSNWPTIPQLFV